MDTQNLKVTKRDKESEQQRNIAKMEKSTTSQT